MTRINAVLATPLGWLFAHTLALPFGAVLIGPGFRTAFLPQTMPHRYVKRTAAMLVLRPATLLANWADVGALEISGSRQTATTRWRLRRLRFPAIGIRWCRRSSIR